MSHQGSARSRLMLLVAALFVFAGNVSAGNPPATTTNDPKETTAPAQVFIRLGEDAKLFVDDEAYTGRAWKTPPLEPGWNYNYALRAEVTRDGQTTTVRKEIKVWAGATTTVDFGDLSGPVVVKTEEPATSRHGQILPEEQEVIDHINTYRQASGLAPLKLNPLLCEVSRGHSANMARLNRMGHFLEGRGPDQRCAAAGYYGYSGENVASGSPDSPQRFFQLWVNSSGHRRNMLGNHNEVGVGFAISSGGSYYYTAVFGVGSSQ